MISVTNLAMSFGPKILFTDVNLDLNQGNKYAVVGANGCGKSTFLKVLASTEEPMGGEVTIQKRAKLGWLKQDQFLYENTSIINTVIAGKAELWKAMQEKEAIFAKEEMTEEDGYKIGELEGIIFENDGYVAESVAANLLSGLGIKEEFHHKPLSVLSGGYKLRVLLAQSLFENPDILLLDEPTNHLDMPSIYWLENYLKSKFKGVLVFISHDTVFLNNLATHVLDIDYGEIRQYVGNYAAFEKEKVAVMEAKLNEKEYLEKKIAQMRVFVDKFRAGTRSRQSASREKLIDKIELPTIDKSSRISPNFLFKQKRPSGKQVIEVKGICKSYGVNKVLNNVNFAINKGEKVIVVGPNGMGKSTLLKIITNNLTHDEGSVTWGYETHVSYFAQDHHDQLHESKSVIDWFSEQTTEDNVTKIRTMLGNVLFRKDDVNKNILNLSGGEGARLLMGKIMLEEPNVLILDEPTNHLDIESKDALKEALKKYEGTLIMVTHDRDFAISVANRIIALTPKKIIDFKGKYSEYLAAHEKDFLIQVEN